MNLHVELRGLTKNWAQRPALKGLSLTLKPGRITALLGPSGCGKTTALKIVAGLLAPDAGDVLFDGVSQNVLPPEKREAVMVFQDGLLFPRMTVSQNLGFGLRMRGLDTILVREKVGDMLAALHLSGLQNALPHQLSGGQAQRVALGRALILRPKVLLLDEPLASLDPHLRGEMQSLIRDLQRQTGITTLMVTHDQAEAVAIADHIALMFEGELRQSGTVRDFLDRPRDEQVARFFGGCNFLPGVVQGGRFHGPFGPLQLTQTAPDGPAQLTIRPEAIRLGPGPNCLDAKVTSFRDLGSSLRLTCRKDHVELTLFLPPGPAPALGENLAIHLPPDALALIPPARLPAVQ